MTEKQCTFCKSVTEEVTEGSINNDRPNVFYEGVEKSNTAKVYICKKKECSLKYRQALNEIDWI